MIRTKVIVAFVGVVALTGCAHLIVITPDVSQLDPRTVTPVDRNVGYVISEADRGKQVETPGGGGDKVSYYPYRELEPALFRVLSNLFNRVYRLGALSDADAPRANNITLVFVPEIETSSSSDGAFTWPPTDFAVNLTCRVFDRDGKLILERRVMGKGRASFSEFKSDFALAAKRAGLNAMLNLQRELSDARELRR